MLAFQRMENPSPFESMGRAPRGLGWEWVNAAIGVWGRDARWMDRERERIVAKDDDERLSL
ncbi:hypothetical protein ACFB49_27310 [Sphingomonas sp. DBB INV C78]